MDFPLLEMGRRPSDRTGTKTTRHDRMALWMLEDDNQQRVAYKILRSKPEFERYDLEEIERQTIRKRGQILSSKMLYSEIIDLELEVVGTAQDCDYIMIFKPKILDSNGEDGVYAAVIELKPEILSGTGTVSQIKKYKKKFADTIREKCIRRNVKLLAIDGILVTEDPNNMCDPLFEKEGIPILRVLKPQQQFFTEWEDEENSN